MQEKFLPDSSLTSKNKLESTMLREFLQKTTHNFKSFREEFDFLNDESIMIRSQTLSIAVNSKKFDLESDRKTSNFNLLDSGRKANMEIKFDDAETELIELDETETKVYGFWHRNENLIINTKFDNFGPETNELGENLNNNMSALNSEGLDQINSYIPSSVKTMISNLENLNEFVRADDYQLFAFDDEENIAEKKNEEEIEIIYELHEPRKVLMTNDGREVEFPGQIQDSKESEMNCKEDDFLADIFKVKKLARLRKLDIYSYKSEADKQNLIISSNSELDKRSSQVEEYKNVSIVENFELEENYDYNRNISKSRYESFIGFMETK